MNKHERIGFEPVFTIRATIPTTPAADFEKLPREARMNYLKSLRLRGVAYLGTALADFKTVVRYFEQDKAVLRI